MTCVPVVVMAFREATESRLPGWGGRQPTGIPLPQPQPLQSPAFSDSILKTLLRAYLLKLRPQCVVKDGHTEDVHY